MLRREYNVPIFLSEFIFHTLSEASERLGGRLPEKYEVAGGFFRQLLLLERATLIPAAEILGDISASRSGTN